MSEWISVEESLPEIKQGVVVWMSYKGFNEYNIAVTTFDKYGFNLSNVTHWQPLPEAPKGEINND